MDRYNSNSNMVSTTFDHFRNTRIIRAHDRAIVYTRFFSLTLYMFLTPNTIYIRIIFMSLGRYGNTLYNTGVYT